MSVVQKFKFGPKTVTLKIRKQCCYSVDFLQEIGFNHLVGASWLLLHDFRDHFLNL